jgi:hypothetical protein
MRPPPPFLYCFLLFSFMSFSFLRERNSLMASCKALYVVFPDDLSTILIKPQSQSPPLVGQYFIQLTFRLLYRIVCQICEVSNDFFKVKSSFLLQFQPAKHPSTALSNIPVSQHHQSLLHPTAPRQRVAFTSLCVDLMRQRASSHHLPLSYPPPKLLFYGFFSR